MEIVLGEKLKELREKKGYKQADVADLVPVSPSGYRGWESGTTIPDTRTLAKLCEIFEVSADYLLFGKEEEKKTEGVYELENLQGRRSGCRRWHPQQKWVCHLHGVPPEEPRRKGKEVSCTCPTL